MSNILVEANIRVRAIINADNLNEAKRHLKERIEATQCWQAWGEPKTLEDDALISWVEPYPVVVEML